MPKAPPAAASGGQLPPHKVTVELVLLTSLKVDVVNTTEPTQRDLAPDRVNKLLNAPFDVNAAGTIIVNRRKPEDGGGDYVVDGWCRTTVGIMTGVTHLRAEVHHGLSIPDEAKLFRLKNKEVKGVPVLDLYRVALTEGDPVAVDTKKALDLYNLTMGGSGPNNVGSVAAILKVTREHGFDALERAFYTAEKAWGRRPLTWDGSIIGGLGRFYGKHGSDPRVKPDEVARKIAAEWGDPLLCKGKIQFLATAGGAHYDGSMGRTAAAYRAFVHVYNKGRRGPKNKIDPQD